MSIPRESLVRRAIRRLRRKPPGPVPPWASDDRPFRVVPFDRMQEGEGAGARAYWAERPPAPYFASFQPQTLLLIYALARLGAASAFEFGCNVGRNLHWLRRTLGIRVAGIDVNPSAIAEGRRYFGFGDELRVGDLDTLRSLPPRSFDVTFTVSVLDHVLDVEDTLRAMLRATSQRVVLIELTLPEFGRVEDARCMEFSYSHDYDAILGRLPCRVESKVPSPLGEGLIEHYTTYEISPVSA